MGQLVSAFVSHLANILVTRKPVNFFIYAKDFSGSTNGDRFYHRNGLKTYKEFKSYVEKINQELKLKEDSPTKCKVIYLHWGHKCFEVNENEIVSTYKKLQSSNMCTEPKTIIEWIKNNYNICDKNNKIKLLYIVTDGLIDNDRAEECFELNENIHYENVIFHALNTDLDSIDLSVAASFLKSRCMIYRNYKLYDSVDISEDFYYDKIMIDNFETEKDSLISYIKLKFIRTIKDDARALQEIDKLKKLRKRLFLEFLSKSSQQKIELETKDKVVFLREFKNTIWYQSLINSSQNVKVDIEKTISSLINYINIDQRSYSFDELKFDTNFGNIVEQEPIVDVNFSTEQEIKFPDIILDDDKGIPVIILTELNLIDKIIFHKTKDSAEVSSASFNKFKSTMDCPLFLLNDKDISESIGYFYTLNVYQQLLENTVKAEPRTRRPFHGGLVLVDSDEFDKYNDYILSATYFNSKKVNYNVGLFYFVLWKISERKEWMDRNVVEQFKKYVMRRINTTVCKIGLSSLPLDPQEKTSLLTALWYCVELSSCIFKHDPKHFTHERLRMYYNVAYCMIEILQNFDYDLDLDAVKKRIDLIRNVMILKKISRREEKIYYLLGKIFKKVNGFLVCEIEKPFNLNKLNYLKLDHKCMLRDSVIKKKVRLNNYVHLLHYVDIFSESKHDNDKFEICEKTFRPFFTIDQNKAFYTELLKVTKAVVINNDDDKDKIKIAYDTFDVLEFDRILSLYNLFINCVKDFRKYPTFSEYIEYILAKKKFYGNKVTIFPPNVHFAADKVYSGYQNVIKNVNVKDFIYASKKYAARPERVKAEGRVNLRNDSEIKKFICNEESKVWLK